MDTTIQKSYYCFLEKFIKNHINILLNVRVFIFGAGIRGCNLLRLLKIFYIHDIVFVDNNPIKQGVKIEGCNVLSFSEANKYMGKNVFLCPIENGQDILKQLALSGRTENIDYFNLDYEFKDYLYLIEEIKRPALNYSLVFGCCILSSNILGKSFNLSLGEQMKQQLFSNSKLCTLPGFSPAIYYFITNTSIQLNKNPPKFVFLTMEISSCSPYAPIMLGKQNLIQHNLFIKELKKLVPSCDEISEYSQIVMERLNRSIAQKNPAQTDNTLEAKKQIYKLKYNYIIREQDESIIYLKKILKLLNEKKIPAILFFPPIDYLYAKKVCNENFCKKYYEIINKMKLYLCEYSYSIIDASFLVNSEGFLQQIYSPDINPFLNQIGQKKLLNFLNSQNDLQRFLVKENN